MSKTGVNVAHLYSKFGIAHLSDATHSILVTNMHAYAYIHAMITGGPGLELLLALDADRVGRPAASASELLPLLFVCSLGLEQPKRIYVCFGVGASTLLGCFCFGALALPQFFVLLGASEFAPCPGFLLSTNSIRGTYYAGGIPRLEKLRCKYT